MSAKQKPVIVREKESLSRGRPKLGRVRLQITLSPIGKEIAFRLAEQRNCTVGQIFDEMLREVVSDD